MAPRMEAGAEEAEQEAGWTWVPETLAPSPLPYAAYLQLSKREQTLVSFGS